MAYRFKLQTATVMLVTVALCWPIMAAPAEDIQAERFFSREQRNLELRGASLFERVLALNAVEEPELNRDEARKRFADLMTLARSAIAEMQTPRGKVSRLCAILLGDRGVQYRSVKYARDSTLAAGLRGIGNCLAFSTLLLVAADELKLPLHLVLTSNHAFIRWDDGVERFNIETTQFGTELPDEHYFQNTDETRSHGYGRSLSTAQALAELQQNAAFAHMRNDRFAEALELIEAAIASVPDSIELKLQRCELMLDVPGCRSEARKVIQAYIDKSSELPPRFAANALRLAARDAAENGDHKKAYELYMKACSFKSDAYGLSCLAFSFRALKDHKKAREAMDLAVMMRPDCATYYYNLAILKRDAGEPESALASVQRAKAFDPDCWYVRMQEAGCLIQMGRKDEGLRLYESIPRPSGEGDFWEIMNCWILGKAGLREKFYAAFQHALETAHSRRILVWIDEDPDLDAYRNDAEFKALVEKHQARLRD